MSLISDPDYLIHRSRLKYLRNLDDPYGARVISLSPWYQSNPYILAASLADVERWPELTMPNSPDITDDESDPTKNNISPSGYPGATSLKHSQTILGPSRTGAFGLRVSGKRVPSFTRRSSRQMRPQNDAAETPVRISTGADDHASSQLSSMPKVHGNDNAPQHAPAENVPPKHEQSAIAERHDKVQFVPKFKGAAEMEARRKMRMMARRGPLPLNVKTEPLAPEYLNPELSSSDEEDVAESTSEDGNDEDVHGDFDEDELLLVDDIDVGDEFDPDFAATPTPGVNSDSVSDALSILSGAVSGSNPPASSRPRLSPVSEGYSNAEDRDASPSKRPSGKPTVTSTVAQKAAIIPPKSESPATTLFTSPSQTQDIIFTRRNVPPVRLQKSALTAMLASSSSLSNPYGELYANISGRGEVAAIEVQVFFPHAREPSNCPLTLRVKKDAIVEEVIGFALWSYWEEGWLPKLNEGITDENDPKLSTTGWIMRMAEDDGEVDEDFPPPDRLLNIQKFNFGAFAVLEASPSQVQQNTLLEMKLQRPAKSTVPKRAETAPANNLAPQSVTGPSMLFGSTTPILSSSLGPSSSHGPQIFLRVRVADTADAVHISTTIPVSAGMYMQEALELVCRKGKLANPKDYSLILNDGEMLILIPVDRTVASLQGKRELTLVKRSMLPQLGIEPEDRMGRTTDPNASIFKRISDVPEVQMSAAMDYTAAYKKYTVHRKMPVLARQERILAIDGLYVHLMPSANKAKAVFDSGKPLSFHIKSIVNCQQSTKTSTLFKIVVARGDRNKRYDFEADTPKLAGEIVQTVRALKAALERSGTVSKSRRSRHVG